MKRFAKKNILRFPVSRQPVNPQLRCNCCWCHHIIQSLIDSKNLFFETEFCKSCGKYSSRIRRLPKKSFRQIS